MSEKNEKIGIPENSIIFPNGDRLRKWITTLLPLVMLVVGSIYAFANIGNSLVRLDEKIDSEIKSVKLTIKTNELLACDKILQIQEKVKGLNSDGSTLSHNNERRIIGMEKDVGYTKEAVKRIESLLKEIADRQRIDNP